MIIYNVLGTPQPTFFLYGAIAGVILSLVAYWIKKFIDHKFTIKLRNLNLATQLEKEYLIEPVIALIDHDIKSMQNLYSRNFNKGEVDTGSTTSYYDEISLACVEVRINVLEDETLKSKFSKFSIIKTKVATAVSRGKTEDSYQEMLKAILLGGEILAILFKKLKGH